MRVDDNVGGQIVIIYCTYAEACLDCFNEKQRIEVDALLRDNYLRVILFIAEK